MKNWTKVLIGIGAVVLLAVFWFFGTRNSLVSLKEDVEMQQSQIETTLQRRSDLIPNLVATVKGYANHEEEVFTEIADARSKLAGSIESGDMKSISEANNALDSALGRLLAISENYPDLKASEQFIALQDELAGTENRIAVARQHYNEKLNTYNTTVQRFPTSIVAGMSGYYPMQYFEADESAKKVPKVDFD
ncbi:MAG: LemA family protein [Clostridia bacterium]|jgi:LemA protein